MDLVDGKSFLEFLGLYNDRHDSMVCPHWGFGYPWYCSSGFWENRTRIPLDDIRKAPVYAKHV